MDKGAVRKIITLTGIVQGVGFRPAIARQASGSALTGHVLNTRDSVEIEIQGSMESVEAFENDFYSFIPERSVINSYKSGNIPPVEGEEGFSIIESREQGPTRFSIPPDIAMCRKCFSEFSDPGNRRYRYPFITCGECGPRYTYMRDMPYDRSRTTMSAFPMCSDCLKEYNDPSNRRYHIEGFSCPQCGPVLSGFDETAEALKSGKIAAVKGLGGYHIACSALNEEAVEILRQRKKRDAKPFAVMFSSVEMAEQYLSVAENEKKVLESAVSPIVIVEKKFRKELAGAVAPENGYLGIMIAYTPLHRLLLDAVGEPLIMTSANIAGDPLIIDDARALQELREIADVFLVHDREILKRADDSIAWVDGEKEVSVRMGRGRMPFPLRIESSSDKRVLALGAELKNNVSLICEGNLVTSNHIGDLGTPETFSHFRETVDEMLEYYDMSPDLIVADMHPDYESTAFAREYSASRGIEMKQVQHHYAHFLSAYFENGLTGRAAGIIFDSTGFGGDGTIWGGEFFTGDLAGFKREGHLGTFPLPGGERAIREPWRILSGLLEEDQFRHMFQGMDSSTVENILSVSGNRSFSPVTSSAGRLFDAAGVMAGFSKSVTYEAQAAIYLEDLALKSAETGCIDIPVTCRGEMYIADSAAFFRELYRERDRNPSDMAALFHNSLARSAADIITQICSEQGLENVILSGGVFQNRIMFRQIQKRLASAGLNVFFNRKIPANDAGVSAGQAVYGVYNA